MPLATAKKTSRAGSNGDSKRVAPPRKIKLLSAVGKPIDLQSLPKVKAFEPSMASTTIDALNGAVIPNAPIYEYPVSTAPRKFGDSSPEAMDHAALRRGIICDLVKAGYWHVRDLQAILLAPTSLGGLGEKVSDSLIYQDRQRAVEALKEQSKELTKLAPEAIIANLVTMHRNIAPIQDAHPTDPALFYMRLAILDRLTEHHGTRFKDRLAAGTTEASITPDDVETILARADKMTTKVLVKGRPDTL